MECDVSSWGQRRGKASQSKRWKASLTLRPSIWSRSDPTAVERFPLIFDLCSGFFSENETKVEGETPQIKSETSASLCNSVMAHVRQSRPDSNLVFLDPLICSRLTRKRGGMRSLVGSQAQHVIEASLSNKAISSSFRAKCGTS